MPMRFAERTYGLVRASTAILLTASGVMASLAGAQTGPPSENTLGGREIVAMWCHLCHSGIVFDRTAGERELTFAHAWRAFYPDSRRMQP